MKKNLLNANLLLLLGLSVGGTAVLSATITIKDRDTSAVLASCEVDSLSVGTSDMALTVVKDSQNCFGVTDPVDQTPPTLTSLNPSDNSTISNAGANLYAQFNETVQAGTGSIALYTSAGAVVESFNVASGTGTGGGTVSFSSSTVTLNPAANLADGSYYVQIPPTAIDDAAGNSYAGITNTTTWSFTVDTTGPGSNVIIVAPSLYVPGPSSPATPEAGMEDDKIYAIEFDNTDGITTNNLAFSGNEYVDFYTTNTYGLEFVEVDVFFSYTAGVENEVSGAGCVATLSSGSVYTNSIYSSIDVCPLDQSKGKWYLNVSVAKVNGNPVVSGCGATKRCTIGAKLVKP